MKLEVEQRSGKRLCTIEVPNDATLEDLKLAFDETCHYYPERQRWTLNSSQILADGKLADQGVKNGSVLKFKDLGVQISWRLVFVLEYLGPLLIAPWFYLQSTQRNMTQHVAFGLMMFHFLKRELETLFIHRFSHGTMPIIRLPINCFHYWVLCAVAISYYVFHPQYRAPFEGKNAIIYTLATLMMVFELLNFRTHLILRNLRPRNSKARSIPFGWGFDIVSCANYLWEILAWTCYAMLVSCLTAWLFLLVATFQMTEWAVKKHKNYHKEFKSYPRSRKAIFPFFL